MAQQHGHTPSPTVSDTLRRLFRALGITQAQAAAAVGMPESTMHNRLARNLFTVSDVIKLANSLDIRLSFTNCIDGQIIVAFPPDTLLKTIKHRGGLTVQKQNLTPVKVKHKYTPKD